MCFNVIQQVCLFTEETQNQKQMYETRIAQLEKEREQLTHEIETLNKKLQMQQRQLENLQKQATGVCFNHCCLNMFLNLDLG